MKLKIGDTEAIFDGFTWSCGDKIIADLLNDRYAPGKNGISATFPPEMIAIQAANDLGVEIEGIKPFQFGDVIGDDNARTD